MAMTALNLTAAITFEGEVGDTGDATGALAAVQSMSGWNRALLVTTIVLFFTLSVISGRVLWTHHAAKRALRRTRANSIGGGNVKPTGYSATQALLPPQFNGNGNGAIASTTTSSSSALLEDDEGASASIGAEMRYRFFVLLFLASTIRVFSLFAEIGTLTAAMASSADSWASRLLTLFLWLPSLLFVSMYGLVLLFWAQLCYACWGKAYPWPRRIFFLFNVLLYGTFFVLFGVTQTSWGFWRSCDLVVGSVYLMGLLGILYYSIRLIYFFRNQTPDEDFFFDLPTMASHDSLPFCSSPASPRQRVLRRITGVCILLCILFTAKSVYLIGMGTGYIQSEEAQYRSPLGVHHIAFEFAVHFTTEFVPCAMLIFFTRSDSSTSSQRSTPVGSSFPSSNNKQPATPSVAFRGRASSNNSTNNSSTTSSHNLNSHFNDDVGSGLGGYQYQVTTSTQRSYGTTNGPRADYLRP